MYHRSGTAAVGQQQDMLKNTICVNEYHSSQKGFYFNVFFLFQKKNNHIKDSSLQSTEG